MHDTDVTDPLVCKQYFSVVMSIYVTKDGKRTQERGMSVYEVRDGKIVDERFVYAVQ